MNNKEKRDELLKHGDRTVAHPGDILRNQYLFKMNLSISRAAQGMKMCRETLRDFILGRTALTPDLACRLARYLGTSADFWLRLQHSFDCKYTAHVARKPEYSVIFLAEEYKPATNKRKPRK